jgi:glycosyltransferase involved in cell wall biosynthesis
MNANDPLVSIVIPTHNRRVLLEQAVLSVLAQTYTRWELIIVDDGSTDDTPVYLDAITDPRIRTLHQRHSGRISTTRNAGVRVARGELVAFLDSDDLWPPRKLALQATKIVEAPDCGWCYGKSQLIDESGKALPRDPIPAGDLASGWVLLNVLLLNRVALATPGMMVKRAVFEQIGGYDESLELAEDFDLGVRLAQSSQVCAVGDVVALVRVHAGRTTKQRSDMHYWKAVTYNKARGALSDPIARRICTRMQASHLASSAAQAWRDGHYRSAVGTFLHSASRGIGHKSWWFRCFCGTMNRLFPRAYR